jgi:drug/metabolite transporter (DMT)-like permease
LKKKDDTIFWAIVACLLWSTAYAGIKIGLQYDTPMHFAGARFIISGLMIFPFAGKLSQFIPMIKKHWKIVAWVTFLQGLVNYILFYHGLNLVPGALGAVIVGSQPLVTAVVAAMMHDADKLTRKKVITIIFGISGVILISAGRQALKIGDLVELVGVLMILIANISTAVSNVMVALKSNGLNPLILSSTSLFVSGLLLFLLSLPFEPRPAANAPTQYWVVLSWLSFMSAFAFSIWFKLLQRPHVKVSELNLWKFIIPVVGAILSWLFVPGEKPEWLTITGMVIITGSLVLFSTNGRKISVS